MSKLDVMQLPVDQVDELFRESAMSAEEKAQDFIEMQVGLAFREANPGFDPTDNNVALLENYTRALGLPITVANLERAYSQLVDEGSIVPKPQPQTVTAPNERIVGKTKFEVRR